GPGSKDLGGVGRRVAPEEPAGGRAHRRRARPHDGNRSCPGVWRPRRARARTTYHARRRRVPRFRLVAGSRRIRIGRRADDVLLARGAAQASAVSEADGLSRRGRRRRRDHRLLVRADARRGRPERSPLRRARDRRRGKRTASRDVAGGGGGVTGCSCARTLAEAGLSVRLYEAREIAGGASGRNGGFALRGGAAPYPVLAEAIGRARTAELWRWTERAVEDLADVAGDSFRRTGSLRLAADEEEQVELAEEYEALRADGFAVEWAGELAPPLRGRYPG